MYPTEKQSLYIERLEANLLNSLTSALYDTSGQRNQHVIKRRFPRPMTNDDIQTIINAINKFTAMNKPLLWKRYQKEAIEPKEFDIYMTQYRTLTRFYDLPLESELVRSFSDWDKKKEPRR